MNNDINKMNKFIDWLTNKVKSKHCPLSNDKFIKILTKSN